LERPFIAHLLKQIYSLKSPQVKFFYPYLLTHYQQELLTIVDNPRVFIVNYLLQFSIYKVTFVNNVINIHINIYILLTGKICIKINK